MARGEIDVAIIGAGPAGLSAALWLGRCGRQVVVYDSGHPRNKASHALHGYLSRDGVAPRDLCRFGREDVSAYASVNFRAARVERVRRRADGFEITSVRGAKIRARLVLLATGRHDDLPAVPGFAKFYGRGLYHCPYCDGWEHRGQRLVIYDPKCAGLGLVEVLRTWSQDLVLCTDGSKPTPQALRLRVPIVTEKIVRAEGGRNRPLSRLRLVGGSALQCDAVFFSSNCVQKSKLPVALGCTLDASGSVVCRTHAAKGVPGLFVAGNVRGGVHLAITAAAEGAEAALAMNEWLLDADRPSGGGRQQHGQIGD